MTFRSFRIFGVEDGITPCWVPEMSDLAMRGVKLNIGPFQDLQRGGGLSLPRCLCQQGCSQAADRLEANYRTLSESTI